MLKKSEPKFTVLNTSIRTTLRKFIDPWTRGAQDHEENYYLYSHQGQYLLVPNTPVEVCLHCGMVYYDAAVLKEIERRFFAIQDKEEEPDQYIEMPTKAYT